MIYDKLLSLYVSELGRLETNVITATNNIIKTDSSDYALVELIKAKAVEEWPGTISDRCLIMLKCLNILIELNYTKLIKMLLQAGRCAQHLTAFFYFFGNFFAVSVKPRI